MTKMLACIVYTVSASNQEYATAICLSFGHQILISLKEMF